MNKIKFVYLEENFGVYKCSDENNSACIRKFLDNNGIKSEQFIEDNLVNIIDSVDDIMISECENIAFYIDMKNLRITKLLSKEIKDNYEDIKVIWFGQVGDFEKHLQDEYVDVILIGNEEKALLEIVNDTEICEVDGIAYIEDDEIVLKETITEDNHKLEFENSIIRIENLDQQNIEVLRQNGSSVVTIIIDDEKYAENLKLISEVKDVTFNINIITEGEEVNKAILENLNGLQVAEVIVVDKKSGNYRYLDINENNSLYKKAMLNGIDASITGFYPDNIIGNCSKHVTVNKEKITAKDYDYLKDFLSLNSAIIHHSDNSEGYMEHVLESEKVNCYLPHYHKVNKDEQAKIDNSNIMKTLNFINYAEVNDDLEDSYIKIETNDDLERLLSDVKEFRETGIVKGYFVRNKVENECRWSVNNNCKLKNLLRFNVSDNGDIVPCRGCSTVLGNIKDGYSASVRKVYKHMDKTHITRGCSSCEVSNNCSKCSMMADSIGEESYCNIKRRTPEITDYFIKKNILSYLINGTSTFRGVECECIKFSTSYVTHLFPKEIAATGDSLIQPHISLIFAGETPILIDLLTGNLIKISSELAFVIEGLMKGFGVEVINSEFENIISDEACNINELTVSCVDFLAKSNYTKVVA